MINEKVNCPKTWDMSENREQSQKLVLMNNVEQKLLNVFCSEVGFTPTSQRAQG